MRLSIEQYKEKNEEECTERIINEFQEYIKANKMRNSEDQTVQKRRDNYILKMWMNKQAVSLSKLRKFKVPISITGSIDRKNILLKSSNFNIDILDKDYLQSGIDDFLQKEKELSKSQIILKDEKRVTLKDIYLDKYMMLKQPIKLHASYQNNLHQLLQDDLYKFVKKQQKMGLDLRELPQIEIDKIDKTKRQRQEKQQIDALKAVRIRINKNKENQKNKKEYQRPRINSVYDIRMNGFDMNVAKNIVTTSNWIDKSVHFCRKGIYKLTKIKSKNQILKDRITESIIKYNMPEIQNKVSILPHSNLKVNLLFQIQNYDFIT